MFTALKRRGGWPDLRFRLMGLLAGVAALPTAAVGQTPTNPSGTGGQVATAVTVTMGTENGEVRCGPRRARLPAHAPLEFRVANRADASLWFVAPAFFQATQSIESAGFVLDLVKGGFLVAPQSTVRVLLKTPAPGEYYFSCFAPDGIPNVDSSGFLVVTPAAD